jgi:hypothetical protein
MFGEKIGPIRNAEDGGDTSSGATFASLSQPAINGSFAEPPPYEGSPPFLEEPEDTFTERGLNSDFHGEMEEPGTNKDRHLFLTLTPEQEEILWRHASEKTFAGSRNTSVDGLLVSQASGILDANKGAWRLYNAYIDLMKALAYSGKQLPTQSPVPSAQEQAGTNPNFFSEQVQDKRWYAWDIVHSQKPMDTVQMDRIVDLILYRPITRRLPVTFKPGPTRASRLLL